MAKLVMDTQFNPQPEEHYTPDMAAILDSEPEILAEKFKITVPLATEICEHFRQRDNRNKWEIAYPIVTEVIGLLILESRNLKAKVWGLVFSIGLADVANGSKRHGIGNMTDEAKRQGVSRALLSNYKRGWDKLFDSYGRVFGKSPEACESNRKARLRVLARGKA